MLEPVILVGDVLKRLSGLPAESVHCVVTSPPYFGLRDYGTGSWEGGDPKCEHRVREDARTESSTLGGGKATTGHQREGFRDACGRCGAVRVDRQIGLESTLAEYVEKMVEVFRAVRRVLRADGTVWLNLGDSYMSAPKGPGGDEKSTLTPSGIRHQRDHARSAQVQDQKRVNGEGAAMRPPAVDGLKQKDLMMVPARVALALQADGWWLRSEIVWDKVNPMPESCTDRPTSAHEKLFLLTKSARYFYDADAIREEAAWERWGNQTNGKHEGGESAASWIGSKPKEELQARAVTWDERKAAGASRGNVAFDGNVGAGTQRGVHGEGLSHDLGDPSRGRNKRNVWRIATEPFPDAHFATFPTKLVEPCLLAGTSEKGCCPVCGVPWERVIEQVENIHPGDSGRNDAQGLVQRGKREDGKAIGTIMRERHEAGRERVTVGWLPTCECEDGEVEAPHGIRPDGPFAPVPCTVLDPFAGSGTTLLVARRLNRASIGIELNPEYAELARKRIERWWEKPKRTADEQVDGQLDMFADPLQTRSDESIVPVVLEGERDA